MQGLKGVIIVATIVAATVALGGCFGHHEKAVAHGATEARFRRRRGRAGRSRLTRSQSKFRAEGNSSSAKWIMDAGTP